ncbi:MAG: hypothetical protein WBX25_28100 [Rhodomicrobium sp.]
MAFVQFEGLARDRLEEGLEHNEYIGALEVNYMTTVTAAANAYGIEQLQGWELPDDDDQNSSLAYRRKFRQKATQVALELELRGAARERKYSVVFDGATKEKLRFHLNQIRQTVDKLDIAIGKKERIFNRISDLELEIDKKRTRVEALTAVAMEFTDGMRKAARPVLDVLEEVNEIFGKAKAAEEEQARLPPPKKPKQIEPPKAKPKQLPKKSFDLDDEVPF